MSALENAISMLGSVTATTRADATDVEWTGKGARVLSGARWSTRSTRGSGSAVTELSNTLSLLDSTIVAIDSAMFPPSSSSAHTVTVSAHSRQSAHVTTDAVTLTSGSRPAATYQPEIRPWRLNSSWRDQASSGLTQVSALRRIQNVKLDVRQQGIDNAVLVSQPPAFQWLSSMSSMLPPTCLSYPK